MTPVFAQSPSRRHNEISLGSSDPIGHLRILHTTDLHGQLTGYDYGNDTDGPNCGLLHLSKIIRRQRNEVGSCLLLDSGDFLYGSAISAPTVSAQISTTQHTLGKHPIIGLMNQLGYDAATLGNHEFDHGLSTLPNALSQMTFPVVLSNITKASRAANVLGQLPDHLLLQRTVLCDDGIEHLLRIGILGFMPEQTPQWSFPQHQDSLQLSPMVNAAKTRASQLRAAGAEVIIALLHTGIGVGTELTGPPSRAALAIARTADIDVLLCGHQHQCFPDDTQTQHQGYAHIDHINGLLAGRPATMPGAYGSHLGQIDLVLRRKNDSWRVQSSKCQLLHAEAISHEDKKPLLPYHNIARTSAYRPVAQTRQSFHSHFARFSNNAGAQLVARAQRHAARKILMGRAEENLPLISAAPSFHTGGDSGHKPYFAIPSGPIRPHHLRQLYPYHDLLCLVKITGRELKLWLESCAQNFCTVAPGLPDQPLLELSRPGHFFDHFIGINYCVDLTRPPMQGRIQDVRLHGNPLDDDQLMIAASSSFRMGGDGGVAHLGPGHWLVPPQQTILEAMADYIGTVPTRRLNLPPEPTWHFCRIKRTSVTVPSLVTCLPYLHEIPHLKPEVKPANPPGTVSLKLHL